MPSGVGGFWLRPFPGSSGTNTENQRASDCASGSMYRPETPNPCTSTTGSPSPAVHAWMPTPPATMRRLATPDGRGLTTSAKS